MAYEYRQLFTDFFFRRELYMYESMQELLSRRKYTLVFDFPNTAYSWRRLASLPSLGELDIIHHSLLTQR